MAPSSGETHPFKCDIEGCQRAFEKKQGLLIHQRSCQTKTEERVRDAKYEEKLKPSPEPANVVPLPVPRRVWENPVLRQKHGTEKPVFLGAPRYNPAMTESGRSSILPSALTQGAPHQGGATIYEKDAIRTEYHPHSKLTTRVDKFEDYGKTNGAMRPTPVLSKPWWPFQSRTDFEFSELALDAALMQNQIDTLIGLVTRCARGQDTFNLKSHRDVRATWKAASELHTPFVKEDVLVTYKNIEKTYEFWYLDLWDWVLEMVQDPLLSPYFVWDACRLSKFDGKEWVRFVHEPWTGDCMWNVQSQLPSDTSPIGILLYTDKTKLSSFGTQKGYPIVARCTNLPSEIRNSQGLGGGRVVGWLPIVEESKNYKGSTDFANFKRAVWHECFRKLLGPLGNHSRTGFYVVCRDEHERCLVPFSHIFSADYEEQSVVALTRGNQGLYPCPICLVPADQLSKINTTFPLRDVEETKRLVAEGSEKKLKEQGLRPIENAFWDIQFSDPFKMLSWDRMHNYAHGLGGKHILPVLEKHIEEQGCKSAYKVDEQTASLSCWRNFNHFDKLLDAGYTDATKLEHLIKILLFVSHNVLEKNDSPHGYLLLRLLRSYLTLDIYTSMDVHTTETIAQG